MVILSPRTEELRPDMTEEDFTNGLTDHNVKRREWGPNDDTVQNMSLEINQNFLMFSNVYGEFKSSSINGENMTSNRSFITFRCPQHNINTLIFKCRNGDTISATDVCDSVQDCQDGSDELDSTCKIELALIWWLTIVVATLSILTYLAASLYQYFNERSEDTELEMEEVTEKRNEELRNDGPEKATFTAIYTVCKQIQETLIDKDSTKEKRKEYLSPLLEMYKIKHQEGDGPQRKELCEIISVVKNIGKDPNFRDSTDFVLDEIQEYELTELHQHNEEEAANCLKQTMTKSYSTFDYFLSSHERFGKFAKVKNAVRDISERLVGKVKTFEIALKVSLVVTLVFGIKEIVLNYYDVYLDIMIGAGLHHIEVNFITSIEKSKLVSHIEVGWIKYFFPSLNFISMGLIHIYYFFQINIFYFHKPRPIFRLIAIISLFFPITFTVLEYVRACFAKTKFDRKLSKLMSNSDTTDEKGEKYVRLSHSLNESIEYSVQIQRVLTAFIIIETVVETLPQVIIIIVFLINDVQNDFGPLRSIFMETVVDGINLKAQTISVILISINLFKLSFFQLSVYQMNEFPMAIGIQGYIIKLFETIILVSPKMFLSAVIYRTIPYAFPLSSIIELGIVSMYTKLTKTKTDFIYSVLPATFIPSLFDYRETKPNLKCLKKFRGALNCIILHYVTLLVAYVPAYFVINTRTNNDNRTYYSFTNMEIVAFTWYVASIGPYIVMLSMYHYFGNRKRQLLAERTNDTPFLDLHPEQLPLNEVTNQNSDQSSEDEDSSKPRDLNPKIFVCPIKPKESFMTQNKSLIQNQLDEINRH